MNRKIALTLALSPLLLFAGVEENHLKFYASFDSGLFPEIAKDGAKLQSSGTIPSVDGKNGKALYFASKDNPGDLLYNTGTILAGKEWSIAFWLKLDEAGNHGYGKKGSGRGLFRTNLGWMAGNAFAVFNHWGSFGFTHFSGDKKYCGVSMDSAGFPGGKWMHLVFACKDGRHAVHINGNEASYQKNTDAKAAPPMNVLRIGSMDYRSKDQANGAIDELKLFDKALSAEEAKEIMDSVPGRKNTDVSLYLPFDGKVDGYGFSSFNAAEIVFAKGKSDEGVKVVRHGYDRRGILCLSGVSAGNDSGSMFFYFIPDWSGVDDPNVHGLLCFNGGNLKYSIEKRDGKFFFTMESAGKKQGLPLNANLLSKEKIHRIAAGYDFRNRKIHLSIDGHRCDDVLTLKAPENAVSGTLTIGDIANADTYSKTQAEGVIDELLIVNDYLPSKALETIVQAEENKKTGKRMTAFVNLSVAEQEKALWDLSGAETVETAARKRITLNALWRFQLTDAKRTFHPGDWIYLAVPGRYSGQGNGLADSEFYMRDRKLRKLPRNASYDGRSPYGFVNGWFERAFIADPAWKSKEITLLFDELSSSQTGTVYLNGKFLAHLDTGSMFEIPVPEEKLKFNSYNFLTVHTVDTGQYWAWRGIKGDVSLEIRNKVYSEYPAILTSVKNGLIKYEITLKNKSSKEEKLFAEASVSGKNAPVPLRSPVVRLKPGEVRSLTFQTNWKNAVHWSPETPYLYTCTFRVKNAEGSLLDELPPVRFGFREFEIHGRDFYLNGRKIHLFTHDSWVNSTDLEEARRVARTLKKLGYNSVRTNFGAKDQQIDNIMRVCDEEGLLQVVGVYGVGGREYVLWNDPATQKNLESRMAAVIRKWRNHPSNVIWFLSNNFLGYAWDYHPLKIADGYLPQHKWKKYETCLEGVKILRKYDSSRPYFFQAGGNFGEIYTSNAYFCWWPQTERNAWPEVWSRIGKKPLVIIETSFPYHSSFYGMDLKYRGEKPLFFFENLARYYGPEAYSADDPGMVRETEKTTCGKNGEIWYDAPGFQKLKSDLLAETVLYWRGFDLSGICPFAEIIYAFERNAPYHSLHTPKAWEVPEKDFRRFGWSPDLRKIAYQSDMVHEKPLPVAHALAKALAPKLVFIDGGADEPVDRTRNYKSGDTLEKRIVLINDTMNSVEFKGVWHLGKVSRSFRKTVKPGEIGRVPVRVVLPQVDRKTEFMLKTDILTSGAVAPEPLKVTVYPKLKTAGIEDIALYDTVGKTAKKLDELGIRFRNIRTAKEWNGGLLVIGTESLNPGFMKIAKEQNLARRINDGSACVLIFAQKPGALSLLGLRCTPVYARTVFDSAGGVIGPWAGKSALVPEKPHPAPNTEEIFPVQFWHWNNANIVVSYPILRPSEGAFDIRLSCGKDLIYTPFFELGSGKGKVVFCQLEIANRTKSDPQADELFVSLLRKYSRTPVLKSYPELLTSGKTDEIRRNVEHGANAVLDAKYASSFGLRTEKRKIGRFTLTEAGKKRFAMLTARDRFFRAPVEMTLFHGNGVSALTDPAFIVEKKIGKGTVVFLGMPENPRREERERGLKQGVDSSIVWSAEILENRLLQLKALAERSFGGKTELFAKRFESMHLPLETVDLNGVWEFRSEKTKTWRTCRVPGFYNNILPDIGTEAGFFRYRRTVNLPAAMRGKALQLELGAVDDLDVTYVNGVEIGRTGEDTEGYWSARRLYPVPANLTQSGKLTIEVVVENLRGNGGITGYARLIKPGGAVKRTAFPYTHNQAAYHTEAHVRW